jgi:hypothetical protein
VSPSVGVDELLARLVAQFASPYDLLRELVQNSMDAGSDRVEVVLHTHEIGNAVVFEIEVADTGQGMDEAIIDGELTRLFASSKTGDRTMAGGFGIGFVSVFAWEPESVLVQTGRGAEAWELQFFADRRFEKRSIDEPIEGTIVRMFRRGHAPERPAIARAIRDSLWRWCRFCPLEITFEDRTTGEVESIREDPVPSDEVLATTHEAGDTRVRVAFAVPPHAVLLRRGLVLAEGGPAEILPHAAGKIAASFDHLRVWADSSRLRTDIGRDHVVDDAGRTAVEQIVVAQVQALRGRLVERLVALASSTGTWTADVHREYAYLHAHLRCERDALGDVLDGFAVLRRAAGDAIALADLVRAAVLGVVAWHDPTDSAALTVVPLAARAGIPTLVATQADVDAWLGEWLLARKLAVQPLAAIVRDVTPTREADPITSTIEQLLATAGVAGKIAIGRLGATADALWGLGVPSLPGVAVTGARRLAPDRTHTLWLEERHVLVRAAIVHSAAQPVVAAAAIAFAIAGGWPRPGPDLGALVDAVDALRAGASE